MNRLRIFVGAAFSILLAACAIMSQNNIIRQAEWGGTPARVDSVQSIEFITIHHSGVVFESGKDPLTYLQNLQNWSRTEKQWIDIPYHYLIDLDGKIYEGRDARLAGDTNTSYDVKGHLIICVLGNYEEQTLNEKQYDALVHLTVNRAKHYAVPLENIRSHHDWVPAETVCPGRDIQRLFDDGTFKQTVSALLN
ncbi:MAG: peptidoglycan recognition protein family protein [Lentisphaeria bacterium]|nr:peptidoglycan recognition protein family protein [Candidatus Neomarinimicrobiota bacterium]MCF7841892.1 peptidoglycan recognition protein family protein [Lentisphaeria bacterium]